MMSENEMVTTKQAAEILGLSVGYLYKLMMKKMVPYYKPFGNRCYFKVGELRKVLESGRVATAEENQINALKYSLMK
jgi:excisionase family DNA binding protein